MNTAGWMLTESGRQPWIVQGLMKTSQAISPSVSALEIWISLLVFVALYVGLGVADAFLMIHYGRKDLAAGHDGDDEGGGADDGVDQPPTEPEDDADVEADSDDARVPALIY